MKAVTQHGSRHPRLDHQQKIVYLANPSTPTGQAAWHDPARVATCIPDGEMPQTLNGVVVSPWRDAPATVLDWQCADGLCDDPAEPPFHCPAGYKGAAGAVIVEPDGRIWVVHPSNQFGGYQATFPKGRTDERISLQTTALKEAYEEAGLRIQLMAFLGDFKRTTTMTRLYLAQRIGGSPAEMGWESQAVSLVPLNQLDAMLNGAADKPVLAALQQALKHNIRAQRLLSGPEAATAIRLDPQSVSGYGHPPMAVSQAPLLDQGQPQAAASHKDGAKEIKPAMDLLAQDDSYELMVAKGDDWWIEIGPVDLEAKLVTIQRGDALIAAITARDDGRLRVAVFGQLDVRIANYLIGLGRVPHPDHGVCMRENNWEYALDCSAGNGNYYAADKGDSYLSYWENGLGISWDGTDVPVWRKQIDLVARSPACVVADLVLYDTKSGEDGSAHVTEGSDPNEVDKSVPPAWRRERQPDHTVRQRFLGCLLGGAVGDALGAPVEFMTHTDIRRRFGPKGITGYAPAYGGIGKITDDTQMTLFTADGLLRGWVRGCFKGTTSYVDVTAHAYLRWLQTQGEQPKDDLVFGTDEPGWLFQQRQLHSRRAPGNTCLSALRAMKNLGEPASNNSKGCGGVMRVAPVGLFAQRQDQSLEETFRLGTELAALTHGHPTGALTGGVLAVLILALTDGASLPEALTAAKAILRGERDCEETLAALELAEQLAQSALPAPDAIARLGQGWIAEEALAIAIYCALVARDFEQAVILAVNHDGDSDSTGAIVGNLLGAMHGVAAIPADWLTPLELGDVITELAEDLFAYKDWPISTDSVGEEPSERIWRKYPGF